MKKVGLLVLAVVFAIGVMGVGYAYWQSALTITGTAAAGSWSVIFDGHATEPATPGSVIGSFTTDGPGNETRGTISLSNIYPGYDTGVMGFDVQNAGTVGAWVGIAYHVSTLSPHANPNDLIVTVTPTAPSTVLIPGSTTDTTHFSVRIQMDPGLSAPEGVTASYTITITLTAINAH
jgi:hypothetical protein